MATIRQQIILQEEIIKRAGINIVTCGDCGTTILHKRDLDEIKCHSCGFESDPCDFPDLYHSELDVQNELITDTYANIKDKVIKAEAESLVEDYQNGIKDELESIVAFSLGENIDKDILSDMHDRHFGEQVNII